MWFIAHGFTSPKIGEGDPQEIVEIYGFKGVTFTTSEAAFALACRYGGWVETVVG